MLATTIRIRNVKNTVLSCSIIIEVPLKTMNLHNINSISISLSGNDLSFGDGYHSVNVFNNDCVVKTKSYMVDLNGNKIAGLINANPDIIVLKVLALSINFRDKGDLEFRFKSISHDMSNTKQYFGSDFCAEIIAKGDNVHSLSVGDKVIPNHQYPEFGMTTNKASFGLLFVNKNTVVKSPHPIDPITASTISCPFQTAAALLRKSRLLETRGHSLITAVRSATTQALICLLDYYHLPYTLICRDHDIFQTLSIPEPSHVILADPYNPSTFSLKMKESLEDFKVTHVFDNFPDLYFPLLYDSLSDGCLYLFVGYLNQGSMFQTRCPSEQFSWQELLTKMVVKNISFIGSCLGSKADLETIIDLINQKKLFPSVDSVYSFSDISDYFDRSFNSQKRVGKVSLKMY